MKRSELKLLAEQRLNRGLRDYWYPVLPDWAVHNDPIGITRLSENIVLWRDDDGTVQAIEDRCPHRGARMSLGWNLGNRLACWYHGVEVDGTGTVVNVPAVRNSKLEGRCDLRAYPVVEAHGAIFLYFAEDRDAPPKPLEFPEQLTDPDYSNFLCTAHWRCNYRYAIDNVMDPMHGAYLHAVSHSMFDGDLEAEMQVVPTETGLIFEKTTQKDVNFDWVEFGDTGGLWMRLTIPYQQKFGPGGPFYIVGYVTPVDETNCRVFFWRVRNVQGWQRDVWRFLYRNRLEGLHWQVLEQDRLMLENLPDNAREREVLYSHDQGMNRIRRMLEQKARDQIGALHAEAAE